MQQDRPIVRKSGGASSILVILALPTILAFAALAIDVGWMFVIRHEVRNAADAAALAGARELGRIYACMAPANQRNTVKTAIPTSSPPPQPPPYCPITFTNTIQDLVRDAAQATANANKVTIDDDDISIGTWDTSAAPPFNAAGGPVYDAVQVRVKHQAASTFFMPFSLSNAPEVATAALTYVGTGPASALAISRDWFDIQQCPNNPLTWIGGGSGYSTCIAWLGQNKPGIEPLLQCTYDNNCPLLKVGDPATITNGAISGLFDTPAGVCNSPAIADENEFASGCKTFTALFATMKLRNNDQLGDYDTDPNTWSISVPVVDYHCGQGGTGFSIVGFADITITQNPSNKSITIAPLLGAACHIVEEGRGGGLIHTGNAGTIPSLVE